MISETFALTVNIPLKSGARAAATFTLDTGGELSISQAAEVRKILKSCDGEVYVSMVKTTVDDNFKPWDPPAVADKVA